MIRNNFRDPKAKSIWLKQNDEYNIGYKMAYSDFFPAKKKKSYNQNKSVAFFSGQSGTLYSQKYICK